jgi:hypothetical protein
MNDVLMDIDFRLVLFGIWLDRNIEIKGMCDDLGRGQRDPIG